MKRKVRVTNEEIKEEILDLTPKEIETRTKYIIYFEDYQQDFLEWHIDKRGLVIDSKPFQRSIWAGCFTVPETAEIGKKLAIYFNEEESFVNYPIKDILVKEKEK
jgi:hypothetical protein